MRIQYIFTNEISFSQITIDNNYKNQYEQNKRSKKNLWFLLNIQCTEVWRDGKFISQDFE
jgi:hypothetical protein